MPKFQHSVKPYYAYSQHKTRRGNRFHNQNTSSLEFWRWFDDKCGPEERAVINKAYNQDLLLLWCKDIIKNQGGWANVQD